MKALVFGGTRFIGKRLVEELLTSGASVTLFNRGRTADGFGRAVRRLTGDRRSAGDLSAALGGREFDAVWDFISYSAADVRLVVSALEGRVGHFIHMSTCSVYWCTGDFPCPVAEEEFYRHGDFEERPASIEYEYGYNKRKAEEVLFAAHRERGFPVTTIRCPVVGGEADPSLRYASYCLRLSDGNPLILPDGGLAPFRQVYVGDLARTLAELPAIPSSRGQAFNLASDEILTLRMVVESIARLLGVRLEVVEIPSVTVRASGLPPSFSPFSQPAAQVPAIHKARRDLRWMPTPYASWLERTVRDVMKAKAELPTEPPADAVRSRELDLIAAYRSAVSSITSEGS